MDVQGTVDFAFDAAAEVLVTELDATAVVPFAFSAAALLL